MGRTFVRSFQGLAAAGLLLALVGKVDASTNEQKCIAAKRQATGRAFSALLNCDAKATRAGTSPDPACEAKARTKLEDEWSRAQLKYGTACAGTGELLAAQPILDGAQDDLEASQGVPGAASRCTAGKLKAAGKAGACGLRCASRSILDGLTLADPSLVACRADCAARLDLKVGTLESTAGECHTTGDAGVIGAAVEDFVTAALAVLPVPPSALPFCERPGAVRFTAMGVTEVPGAGMDWPDLGFLHLPEGFCVHYFATVPNARQVRFAPGGELFVASPTKLTTGGGPGGRASVVVLPDDDGDGVADSSASFLSSLPATQGLLFHAGYFYYQDDNDILRRPYAPGDRTPQGPVETVATITHYYSSLHWPKPLDVADDGTIYMGNGGDQGEVCAPPGSFTGGILKLDTPNGTPVARGFRNPISVRCSRGHNRCFAIELAKDFTNAYGGREKLVPVQEGDDWGFPCCATRNVPYSMISPIPDCSSVAMEGVSFEIGHTPFSVDFAPATWPAPFAGSAIVSQHGAYGSWEGARLVAVEMDENTGLPLVGSDIGGVNSGAMVDFATGWDDNTNSHGRPADLTFSSDGRLFLANDTNGIIVWIAPIE